MTSGLHLRHPVKDVNGCCHDIGIEMMGMPHPLQNLLLELYGLPMIQYHIHLVAWIKRHEEKLMFAREWCKAWGQGLEDYYDHLGWGRPPDGLKVMLVSLVIDTWINIVFVDTVCTMAEEGINFSFPTIVWATAGALLCWVFDPEAGNAAE